MRLIQLSDHPGQLLQDAHAHREVPRVRRHWWSWIVGIFSMRAEPRNGPTAHEESIAAGMAGERRVAAELGQVLDDEWVLFRGLIEKDHTSTTVAGKPAGTMRRPGDGLRRKP